VLEIIKCYLSHVFPATSHQFLYPHEKELLLESNLMNTKAMVLTEDGCTLVTGSIDSTVAVFAVKDDEISESPKHILRGHTEEITSIAVNTDLDVCVSSSTDGTCVVHNVRNGALLRTVAHPEGKSVHLVCLAGSGKFVMYSNTRFVDDDLEVSFPLVYLSFSSL
jgi:WD40 repeat protein